MGYDLHITRKNQWSDESGPRIELAEWKALVAHDPELSLDPAPEGGDCVGTSFRGDEGLLWWDDGDIVSKYPNQELLAKMVALAELLNAKVQGDDGEVYQADGSSTPESSAYTARAPGVWSRLFSWLRRRRARRQRQASAPLFHVGCRVRDLWGELGTIIMVDRQAHGGLGTVHVRLDNGREHRVAYVASGLELVEPAPERLD